MRMPGAPARIAACGLLAILFVGCSNRVTTSSTPGPAAALAALPLPGSLSHSTASNGPIIDGAAALQAHHGTTVGQSLKLTPPQAGFAHGIWAVELGDLVLSAFQVKLVTEGQAEVWLGVANFAAGSWWFSGPYLSGAPAVICGPGEFTSTNGVAYIAAVVIGGTASIEQLACGVWMDFPSASGDLLWDAGRMQRLVTDQRAEYSDIVQDVRLAGDYYRGWQVPAGSEWWPPLHNGLMALACAWRMTGDPAYRQKLLEFLERASQLWDFRDGREGAEDLDLGVMLTNLSVSYDWVRSSLSAETRGRIEALLFREAKYAFELFQPRKTRYFWNHAHFVATGLYAAGCVLDGYTPEAKAWREAAAEFFDQMESLQDEKTDAGYPEGCAYASAVYYLAAQYRELRRTYTGSVPPHSWWERAPRYFAATLRPDLKETIRIADDDGRYIYPPEAVMRYVAASTGSQLAQKLASVLKTTTGGQKDSFQLFAWQAALFSDPSVPPAEGLGELTTHLTDLGLVVVRNSWEPDTSLLALRSGLPGGAVYNAYLQAHPEDGYGGLGHQQCDLNSLSWWAGDVCLLSDCGFENVKLTRQHNTITIGGFGQIGEGGAWWGWGWNWKDWGYGGQIARASSSGADGYLVEMRCDDAYVPNAKVVKFRRRVLWLEPNLLIVQDRVGLQEAKDIEVNWMTELGAWSSMSGQAQAGGRLQCRALGLQPDAWRQGSSGIDSNTVGYSLQTVFTGSHGETDLAHVLWDSAAEAGWMLHSASTAALTFTDGARDLSIRVEGAQLVLRGCRSLDLPWGTI